MCIRDSYGEYSGIRIARKHVGWYLAEHDRERRFRAKFNGIDDAAEQLDTLAHYFDHLAGEPTSHLVSPAA